MNEQARYALIGAFVLFGLLAGLWFVIWMGEGLNHGAKKYVVYFDESVIGLLPKAPVTFNGVTVGSVGTMTIPAGNAKKVRVELTIDAGTQVNQSTVAELDTMGLTGVSFVELTATQKHAPPLVLQAGEEFPVIKSKISFLGQLTNHATTLSQNLVGVTEKINQLLNNNNQKAIAQSLQNMAKLTAQLPVTMHRLNHTLAILNQAGTSIVHTSHSIAHTSDLSQRLLTQVNQQTLPATATMMKQLTGVSVAVQGTLKTLKQHPSMLIRGKAVPAFGPGE